MTVHDAEQASDAPASTAPTPSRDGRPRRTADFQTLGDALDFAALGGLGLNFHDARGQLERPYPFRDLREDALRAAAALMAAGVSPGDRVALIAETTPEFAALFFGSVYAGAWPVPLPLPTSFGGREGYIAQLSVQLGNATPSLLLHPAELADLAVEAVTGLPLRAIAWEGFLERAEQCDRALPRNDPDGICYLQYSSGSTRFPHGVAVTHRALLANLRAHAHGMELREGDRCVSWLPWYHDMGLVGCFLSPIANQVSTDYLKTEHFARRPLAWLDLISRNPGTTISYSPTFGYDICARRMSSQQRESGRFDLSRWRLAGNGADMIRPDVMSAFADAFAPMGFDPLAFAPSYGLAEATLAVSIMPPGEGIRTHLVDEAELTGIPSPPGRPKRTRRVVNCGRPVLDTQVEVRDAGGAVQTDGSIGRIWCRGPSVMHSYFRDAAATAAALVDGWLDTGDMGFLSDGYVFVVGRVKDMIIINGKNHWPQDIEWAVERLGGFKPGDIAAFAIEDGGEERPAVLVQCRTSDPDELSRLRTAIGERVRAVTGMNCLVELVPPRSLPRTSSGKLSRAKARQLYLSGDMRVLDLAA